MKKTRKKLALTRVTMATLSEVHGAAWNSETCYPCRSASDRSATCPTHPTYCVTYCGSTNCPVVTYLCPL